MLHNYVTSSLMWSEEHSDVVKVLSVVKIQPIMWLIFENELSIKNGISYSFATVYLGYNYSYS